MKRREFLKAAALSAAAWAMPRGLEAAEAVSAAAGKGRKPNIIFILADDLGLGNVSCCGADNFKTPQLDALAKSGIRFEQAFAEPLCGPSRADCPDAGNISCPAPLSIRPHLGKCSARRVTK